ncbi:hypothetical protein VTN49DRAFT_2950 [Thermomyces lanuginosus]|uniref:uncharacterized protein n=1 Tax=Thermomyces lanuginosus TaxID=5541 RepID=UPI003742720A
MSPVRGYITSYPPRLRQYSNALLTPVIPPTQPGATRTTKRGTTAINYAEDGFDDDDFDDSEGPRRPTGLRSRREDSAADRVPLSEKVGKETDKPVEVQGIFRDWMVKRLVRPLCAEQLYIQSQLPLTLIPIRIDLEVPAHQPAEPFPLPRMATDPGVNATLPAYRKPDPAPAYRIKDTFLWNLHEALSTPEEFATTFVRDLDLPNAQATAQAISTQIRQQLEEYAGVALHDLFQSSHGKQPGPAPATGSAAGTGGRTSRAVSTTPAAAAAAVTSTATTTAVATPESSTGPQQGATTVANASLVVDDEGEDPTLNPDDTYRCIINLNINLQNKLYTDKFEWSLLHPPGVAEEFARVTCADLGLPGEWAGAIAHGIYEAVLKLKKEVCESGAMVVTSGTYTSSYGPEIDNMAANGAEAGWRYDPDTLADEWEPKVETLSKEEIEKREGDRERQIRRLRRETARFSSTAGLAQQQQQDDDYHHHAGQRTTRRKRRLRSLSPSAATPGARGTPDTSGYGGGGGQLTDWERQSWRCSNCQVWGSAVWNVRDGPAGPKTLCHNCGFLYERDRILPEWSKDLHRHDVPLGR